MGLLSLIGLSAFLILACVAEEEYQPGTPGGAWTEAEVDIVREKVTYLLKNENWNWGNKMFVDMWRQQFTNQVWGKKKRRSKIKGWYTKTYTYADAKLRPRTSNIIRLAFHDCIRSEDENGNEYGCDGCLNWEGMNQEYHGSLFYFPKNPNWRALPPIRKTDNNRLAAPTFALERIYTDPNWPAGTTPLPKSLKASGKSRADLWQFAGNVALEIEIAKSNWVCNQPWTGTTQDQVKIIEGVEQCKIKMHRDIPFQYGRADCTKDEAKALSDVPYESTHHERHSNQHGTGNAVIEDLQNDFGMPARQTIALMAVHGLAAQTHNMVMVTKYSWIGNPFLSNFYFKYLAESPTYARGDGLRGSGTAVYVGDKFGNPVPSETNTWTLQCQNQFNTSLTASGLTDSGPCFIRGNMQNCNNNPNPDLRMRSECWTFNKKTGETERVKWPSTPCDSATFDPVTRVQKGGPQRYYCNTEWTFALLFEMGLVMDFTVDDTGRPHGCNIPEHPFLEGLVKPDAEGVMRYKKNNKIPKTQKMQGNLKCGKNLFIHKGETQTTFDIVDSFANNHTVWAKEFLEGWALFQKNGYPDGPDGLKDGPENAVLGYNLENFDTTGWMDKVALDGP